MAGFCPRCGSSVNDNERFCSKCGNPLNSDPHPFRQTYAEQPAYPDYTVPQPQEEYSYPDYAVSEPEDAYGYPDHADSEPRDEYSYPDYAVSQLEEDYAAPRHAAKPKKKGKKGLVAGIITGAVVLLAAAAVVLWMFVFNPDIAVKDAFQKQQEAGVKADYATSFGYSYAAVFGGEGQLEKQIAQQNAFLEEFPEYKEIFANEKCTVLAINSLPSGSITEIQAMLQKHGYTDTEKIQDVKALTYEYRNEKEPEGNRYRLGTCLAIKVSGKWYFNYNDLSYDAPGKVSEE